MPYGGPYKGKDGVEKFFGNIGGAVEMKTFEPKTYLSSSDEVMATGVWSAPGVQLQQTPFLQPERWEHAILPKGPGFPNLALAGLPDAVADALDLRGARQAAASLEAKTFLSIVRNALAHGGILFLNGIGRTEDGVAVRRFAFVSTDHPFKPTELRFLRITMEGYRGFLQSWASWLQASVVQKALDEVVDLEATPEPNEGDEHQAQVGA